MRAQVDDVIWFLAMVVNLQDEQRRIGALMALSAAYGLTYSDLEQRLTLAQAAADGMMAELRERPAS